MNNERKYCEDLTTRRRLRTREVMVGHIPMGGSHPVRLQSMTNTDTLDTKATVEQIKRIADAGADYVRMTTRTLKEARNLENIKSSLLSSGYRIPLVADVHFNPRIAETAAAFVEKVRINPGNYGVADANKGNFEKVRHTFSQLLARLKEHNTALRIGVNHGSLSRRIMDRYGDTPRGMTVSAMEFLRMCREENFHQVVVSMKSSNTRVMVQANRLLVHEMLRENLVYPLHLGVTEAGEGEDGRIKSAIGTGTLLNDGIGDTIRVSLTEAPEREVPVAAQIVRHAIGREASEIPQIQTIPIDPFDYRHRTTSATGQVGGENPPVVLMKEGNVKVGQQQLQPDMLLAEEAPAHGNDSRPRIIPHQKWLNMPQAGNQFPLFDSIRRFLDTGNVEQHPCFIQTDIREMNLVAQLKDHHNVVLLLQAVSRHPTAEQRRFVFAMMEEGIDRPVILHHKYQEGKAESLMLKASCDAGPLFIDGLAEGLLIENEGPVDAGKVVNVGYGILQASRSRIFKTEFISCPGCGRTQFNLEQTARRIRERMGHLRGLKIAVMGCIVNGPGEMADADYGYVGSGPGRITLYRNRQVVKSNIPEKDAVEELVKLIKSYGDWREENA